MQSVKVGIVGGSDQAKICEQLGPNGGAPLFRFVPPEKEIALSLHFVLG
jgi:hypothetical protein